MINPKCFEKNWLENFKSQKYPAIDLTLFERMLYAFELLGNLTKIKNDFIFKGGTSLILLLPQVKRLSIDIDIIGNFSLEELSGITDNSMFTKVEEDEREDKGIPIKHFKFYYNSKLNGKELYILLDTLETENPYNNVSQKTIKSELFEIDENLQVAVPSIDDILGDKLTAFAPHTIGIPYGKDKSMEIMKQLYDINLLYDSISDLSVFASSYSKIRDVEKSFRQNAHSNEDILNDTFQAASKICRLDFKDYKEDDETGELRLGVKSVTSFLLDRSFNLPTAKAAASKAALLSTLLRFPKNKIKLNELKFDNNKLEVIRDFQFPKELHPLNALKRVNVEAFYYWYLITKVNEDLNWINL
jgi:predicted nucleotidyltransferase component of viral defense system